MSGFKDLVVLKSTGSEFHDFLVDEYTTLIPTTDRVMATSLVARWRYLGTDVDWAACYAGIKQIMLEQFAEVQSLALQQTLYEMGRAALEAYDEVAEIKFSAPNKHHFVYDLSPFGLENPNEVFHADDRPYGLIQATVMRDDAPPAGRAWDTIPGFCYAEPRDDLVTKIIIEGAHVVTNDGPRTEYSSGHVVVEDNRIIAVGDGPAGDDHQGRRVNGAGCLVTPGFVNTHHHLYQWVTRGFAVDGTLFEWLTTLYPVWAQLDADITRTAATGALATLAKSGCTTSTDHHYVFPHGVNGSGSNGSGSEDLLGAEIDAARTVGLRFHPTRGSMDLGQSKGGLPPDHVVEDIDTILAASEQAIDTYHDPSFDSMLRIALAPCSPFSVTGDLLRASADLARRKGVRLHTHLCETLDEEAYCREHFNATPVEYMESVGWLGPDVWYAHAVWLDDASIAKMAATGHQRRALPVLQRPARFGHRPGARHARCGHRCGTGRGRRRVERVLRAVGGVAARGAVRPRPRRPAGADRTRRRRPGDHGRRSGAGPAGRDRVARGGQAG